MWWVDFLSNLSMWRLDCDELTMWQVDRYPFDCQWFRSSFEGLLNIAPSIQSCQWKIKCALTKDLSAMETVTSSNIISPVCWLDRWHLISEATMLTLWLSYMNNVVVTTTNSLLCSGLQSSTTILYVTPWLCTKFSERAFSHAGPAARNSLPANIRAESSRFNF